MCRAAAGALPRRAPGAPGVCDPRGPGRIRDLRGGAGRQAHLEDLEVGHGLRGRRPGTGVHDGVGLPGTARVGGQPLDQFLVLVVHGDG